MGSGVYVHIPFCARKCGYCDFCTLDLKTHSEKVQPYHEALKKEIELYSSLERVDTLYLGGGSPSLYPVELLGDLIETLGKNFKLQLVEASIEANPWELTREKLYDWKLVGFDRLSVGVQSLDENILKTSNRPVPEDLPARLELARNAFDNLNLDFILGLPGENRLNVKNNLKLIESVEPDHISYYMFDTDHEVALMTLVRNDIIKLPDRDTIEKLHDFVVVSMERMGYKRYEISSWSKGGKVCLHNLKYWKNDRYFGFGLSAGGHEGFSRYLNSEDLDRYLGALWKGEKPLSYSRENTPVQELFETLFMGLRLTQGVVLSREVFSDELVDEALDKIQAVLGAYLEVEGDNVAFNRRGLDMSRWVFENLMNIKGEIEDAFSA